MGIYAIRADLDNCASNVCVVYRTYAIHIVTTTLGRYIWQNLFTSNYIELTRSLRHTHVRTSVCENERNCIDAVYNVLALQSPSHIFNRYSHVSKKSSINTNTRFPMSSKIAIVLWQIGHSVLIIFTCLLGVLGELLTPTTFFMHSYHVLQFKHFYVECADHAYFWCLECYDLMYTVVVRIAYTLGCKI